MEVGGVVVLDWLLELLFGILKFFLHPVLYISLFLAAYLGVSRVKRERKNFSVRAENAYFELKQLFPIGLIIGLVISVISIAVGLVIPFAAIILIGALTILASLIGRVRLLSPAYAVGLTFFILIFIGGKSLPIPLFQDAFKQLEGTVFPSVAVLLGLFIIGEGFLIYYNGKKGTSPMLITSKRGYKVGIHEAKRLWLVPVFLVIPGSAVTIPFDWWPVFSIGDNMFSLLLVPFAVGFHEKIKGMLPKEAVETQGKRVIALGVVILALSIGSYWVPVLSIIAAGLAILGREVLTIIRYWTEENLPFYFSKRKNGLMILGILPESPASKMGLSIGEVIIKVNGVPVTNKKEFYEALQKNRAYCKLEVVDHNGEVRFAQRALYEGEHHELGILFVHEEEKWTKEI